MAEGGNHPAPETHRLSVADKAAFVLVAVGLLALGGVLFAAGIAVLIALLAAVTVIGGAAVIRYKLFGPPPRPLGRGEIEADAVVLDSPKAPERLTDSSKSPARAD